MRELANPWRRQTVGPGRVRLALSPAALAKLGPVFFIDLPLVGADLEPGVPLITIEAENWVTDLTLPLGGRLVATNPRLRGPVAPGVDPGDWLVELAGEKTKAQGN